MKELLAILENFNARLEAMEEFESGGREAKRMIADLRELTSHMPDFAAAFRPLEVSK